MTVTTIHNNLRWTQYPEARAAAQGAADDESATLREWFADALNQGSALLVYFDDGVPEELAAPVLLAKTAKFAVLDAAETIARQGERL